MKFILDDSELIELVINVNFLIEDEDVGREVKDRTSFFKDSRFVKRVLPRAIAELLDHDKYR